MLENSSENKTFVSVIDGRFTIRVEKNTPKAKERQNKNGILVYELQFDTISGILENVLDISTGNQYGTFRNIVFIIRDGNELYNVAMPYSSRESKGILMRLLNADLTKQIKFKIAKKEHAFTWLTQNDLTVPSKWTKDNPGELPQMVETLINGKKGFDDSEQMKFLFNFIQDNFISKIVARYNNQISNSPQLPETHPITTAVVDDLPF
jgi:hypothetical protein